MSDKQNDDVEMSEITVETEPLLDENAAPPPEKPQPSNDPTKGYPKWLGNAALLVLVFQNTCLIMTMKYASQTKAADGGQAVSSTMVVLVEVCKVTACLGEITFRRRNTGGLFKELHEEIILKPKETALLLIPSFLYLVQNNLLFLAVAHLEPAVYQVLAQLKILTTAFFSILLLQRKLSIIQWISLFLLTGGCIVVQLGASSSSSTKAVNPNIYPLFGLICALAAQFTSGFAGVFCEKMLKASGGGNMAIRNIQLGVPALFFGLGAVMLQDRQVVMEKGFFHGYHEFTWAVIGLHSFGGLLVTVIMKLTSNIAKTFAIAISLVVSTIASIYLFNFIVTVNFVWGSAMVVLATFAFAGLLAPCYECLTPQPKPEKARPEESSPDGKQTA